MQHVLDVGASSGVLALFEALELYVAAATATCNLEYEYNGNTVIEYVTGAQTGAHNDLVIKPVIDDVLPTELDAEFINSLRTVLRAWTHAAKILRDDRARDNALRKSAATAQARATSFDLRSGRRRGLIRLQALHPAPAHSVYSDCSHALRNTLGERP